MALLPRPLASFSLSLLAISGMAYGQATLTPPRGNRTSPPGHPTPATVETPAPAPVAPVAPAPAKATANSDLTAAVVLIKGDVSTGTGFIVATEGKRYLYTAAHVFSGNTRLNIATSTGRKIEKFGPLQAAEGADLIRLEILDSGDLPTLELAPADAVLPLGTTVVVLGDGGGVGVVAAERGQILGQSGDLLEVDAGVIQGNSGGPVITEPGDRVVGLVTHLTAKREDVWSEETRLGGVRRFSCRLNREWEWRTLPLASFMATGRQIVSYDRLTRVGYAISSLSATKDGLRIDRRMQGSETPIAILSDARDLPVVSEILEMNAALAERRMRSSDADLRRRFSSMIHSAHGHLARTTGDLRPAGYAWFHRQEAEASIEWRKTAEIEMKRRIDALRD